MYRKTVRALLNEELEALLQKLAELNALEIQTIGDTAYLPYVMNDAVEDFIRLTQARVMGTLDPDDEEKPLIRICPSKDPTENRTGIIIRQSSGNTVSVWFRSAWQCASCYRYHRIGHDWRSTPGEEDWRRLVNLICVIHDKIEYLGADFTNQEELALAPLAEFTPFSWWSPLDEPVMQWYPSSREGAAAFEQLCREAGDDGLLSETQAYEKRRLELEGQIASRLAPASVQSQEGGQEQGRQEKQGPSSGLRILRRIREDLSEVRILQRIRKDLSEVRILRHIREDLSDGTILRHIREDLSDSRIRRGIRSGRMEEKGQRNLQKELETEHRQMAEKLLLPEHDRVYRTLMEKLEKASSYWPDRDYGKEENTRIQEIRQEVAKRYREAGYEGSYPSFTRKEEDGSHTEVLLVEEHPFTVLEWEDYSFQIYEIRRRMP